MLLRSDPVRAGRRAGGPVVIATGSIAHRLLGIDAGALDDPGTGVTTALALPPWAWALGAIAIVLGVWMSYRSLGGPRRVRAALAACRVLVLLILLVLAAGPRLEHARTLVEPDRVMILLDDSSSMGTSEPIGGAAPEPRRDHLARVLDRHSAALGALQGSRAVTWISFADDASTIDTDAAPPPRRPLRGESTRLGAAIAHALDAGGTSPIAGIVVMSDGRSFDEIDPETRERLDAERIPVFTLPIGSDEPVRDAWVRGVEAPGAAFENDTIPVVVRTGVRGHEAGEEVQIELVDPGTGRVIARQRVRVGEDGTAPDATLTRPAPAPGEHSLLVRVTTRSGRADQTPQNNERELRYRVVGTPMRVLYLDGLPRWEYRYLKNTLLREPSIDATCTLLARDRRFLTEGTPLQGPIPERAEDWAPFDAVIIGDMAPELLTLAQQRSLVEHVERRGCGVLWIAGPGATPARWGATPLGALLPIREDRIASLATAGVVERVMVPTRESARIGILRDEHGRTETRVSDPSAGWSVLRWSAPIDDASLKPGVRVAARGDAADAPDTPALVTLMRYGAGRAGYVGTDEVWRWRYGRGEDLPERFWLPLIRTLGRGTIERRDRSARLVVSPRRPAPGEPTRITLELFDRAAIEALPETLTITLTPPGPRARGEPLAIRGVEERRRGSWTPSRSGEHTLRVSHPALGENPITVRVPVERRDAETRDPSTDFGALRRLAGSTGGRVLEPEDLQRLPDLIPNRTRVTALEPRTTPLWDAPIVLIALIVLLSLEWIGRRALRLA